MKFKIQSSWVMLFTIASAALLFGCDSGKKNGQSRIQAQVQKCFKQNGCDLSCGNIGHFNQLNTRISAYLATPVAGQTTPPSIASAMAMLPAQDSQCYACAAPCVQAAVPPGPTGAVPPTCTASAGSITIPSSQDPIQAATSACATQFGAHLDGSSVVATVPVTQGSPTPQVALPASTTYNFACTCP